MAVRPRVRRKLAPLYSNREFSQGFLRNFKIRSQVMP